MKSLIKLSVRQITLVVMFGFLTLGYTGFAQSTNSLLEIEGSMPFYNVDDLALIEGSHFSSDELRFLGSNQSFLANSYQQLFVVEMEEEMDVEDWMLSPFSHTALETLNQNDFLGSVDDSEEDLVMEDWMTNINEWSL